MIIAFILIPVLIIAFIIGGIIWYRQRIIATIPEENVPRIPFRWRYILLPLIILILTVIITIPFFTKLPAEVGWHFAGDGSPDRWINRTMVLGISIGIQLLFVLVGWGLVLGAARSVTNYQTMVPDFKVSSLLPVMGNLLALPQIIFCFVIADIFSYNIYQKHLLPTWLVIVVTLVIATIVFIVFFALMAAKANKQPVK